MKNHRRGFTLMELLVVIAIISIMAAILFPAFAAVRRNARRAVSTSNLKQCGTALLMYCDDYDGEKDMPSGEVAASLVLKKMPTCDPSDTYRSSCSGEFGRPLIGSYAYVNYLWPDEGPRVQVSIQEFWVDYMTNTKHPLVLYSLFYASHVPAPHHGIGEITPAECGKDSQGCLMPDRVLYFGLDGSVKFKKIEHINNFSWGNVLNSDNS